MRAYLTGASGFVGSHIARVFDAHGAELACPRHAEVDVTDREAVLRSVAAFRPDAIVHSAILNDFAALYADRAAAWDAYAGATRNLVDAANEAGARIVLVSTDWVFDGTQGGATERTPPNPINLYGFLKASSELVVSERADRGSVARIAAVQGRLAQAAGGARGAAMVSAAPRAQDAGFGYFVTTLVNNLRNGERFEVWESDEINMVATPTLASDAAELMWRIVERDLSGVFHCCGGESVDRAALARAAAGVFALDSTLIEFGVEPPRDALPAPIPYDTSLDATATAGALGVELADVADMLRRMCQELAPA